MGDFILTHDEYGKAYFRRIIYLNILLYVLAAIIFVVSMLDIIILLLIAVFGSGLSILYVAYFVYKHPPTGPDLEESQER